MGTVQSVNQYQPIDDSIFDEEIELTERMKQYEGKTLKECIDIRFPNRPRCKYEGAEPFRIDCFKTIEEIETKPFAKLSEITFYDVYIGHPDKRPNITVKRRRNQEYIRYCDVIDDLIAGGSIADIKDLIYCGGCRIGDNTYKANDEEERRFKYKGEIKSHWTPRLFHGKSIKCVTCEKELYLNNAVSDNTAYIIKCQFARQFYQPQPFFHGSFVHYGSSHTRSVINEYEESYCAQCYPKNIQEMQAVKDKLFKQYEIYAKKEIEENRREAGLAMLREVGIDPNYSGGGGGGVAHMWG